MLTKESVLNLRRVLSGKDVTIIGHDNIDVDSFLSGILLSKFLDFINVKNEFCILEEVKEDDTYTIVKELFGIDMKAYQKAEESTARNLFLVDHYETVHDGKVLACIDHHPTSKQNDYKFKYVKNSCATAYLIYEMMQLVDYPLTKEEVKIIVAAMLIDTVSFKSSKTIKEEAAEAKELASKYEIDFNLLERYGLCLTEIAKMTDEEIISNGEKWYSYKRKNDVVSSYLQLYDLPTKELLEYWLNLLKEKLVKTSAEMIVFIIYDMKNDRTYEYQVTSLKNKMILHPEILSRGKDIMPKVEAKIMCS